VRLSLDSSTDCTGLRMILEGWIKQGGLMELGMIGLGRMGANMVRRLAGALRFGAKVPGPVMQLGLVNMEFDYSQGYERLPHDAMMGDATLFQRADMAARVIFMVHGEEKAPARKAVLEGPYEPEQLPAQMIHPKQGKVTWLADSSAAASLTPNGKPTV
jgi:hypothetical protein